MKIDQDWVEDNIDIIMKVFNRLNKSETAPNRAGHKRRMLEDMDRVIYRGYYEIARDYERKKVNKAQSIGIKREEERKNLCIELARDQTDRAIKALENQLIVKDKQIALLVTRNNDVSINLS
tara:strand:+ start:317 stop:682 length:366 start_codon:yes stop_codon:yes gene_type:complete